MENLLKTLFDVVQGSPQFPAAAFEGMSADAAGQKISDCHCPGFAVKGLVTVRALNGYGHEWSS